MFNEEEFVKEFIEAAVAEDNDKMQELAKQTQDLDFATRIAILEKVIEGVKDLDGQEELTKGLEGTLQIMRLAEEVKEREDSTGEEAKDTSKAEEATQDVAADTSAEEAKTKESEASEEGDSPAKEEKEGESSDEEKS